MPQVDCLDSKDLSNALVLQGYSMLESVVAAFAAGGGFHGHNAVLVRGWK